MTPPGGRPQGLATDLKIGILFCTRLPILHSSPIESRDLARASWTFPIAGALVGGVGALAYAVAWGVGLPPALAAAVGIATTLLATGCLHEDGLADVADGFGGGQDRERKLEIMRDSRIGAYGTCALVMSLLLRWAATAAIANPLPVALALVASHVSARAVLPAFMRLVPTARSDGLSAKAGQPTPGCVAVAALLGVMALGGALGPYAMPIGIGLVAAASYFMAWLSVRQIGGQTGDVLGALEQIVEIAVLLVAAGIWKAQP